jgi:hypothetical protein
MSIEEKPLDAANASNRCDDEHQPGPTRTERTIKRENRTYSVMVSACSECGGPLYGLLRECGASLSVYFISQEDYENVEEYVDRLDETFKVNVQLILEKLCKTIAEYNERGHFEAEGLDVYDVRLLDRARGAS